MSPNLDVGAHDVPVPTFGKQPLFARSKLCGNVVVAAKALLGAVVLHRLQDGTQLCGRIVETEAYDQKEASCHAYLGPKRRHKSIYQKPGYAYVYRSYGLHWCINVVADKEGYGAAVLLRALVPLCGQTQMHQNRGLALAPKNLRRLCCGPGNLTQALAINNHHDGIDLLDMKNALTLVVGPSQKRGFISQGPRIGITRATELPWRFTLHDARSFVSSPKPKEASSKKSCPSVTSSRRV